MEYVTGKVTLRAIFALHWAAYCSWYKGVIRDAVYENVQKILSCRTFLLGYHLYQCPGCSAIRMMPHSCKSRFCSCCGKIATDKWTEERLSDILAVGYHHLVFTLPWQLRLICLVNRQVMFQLLFSAASWSLQSWTLQYGGYVPGIYIVLHTFGSDLKFNPHFHVLITAGGISFDHQKWISAPQNFLMPHKGLKKRWKHSVMKGLITANEKNLLEMPFLPKKCQYVNLRGVISTIAKLCWYINIGARLLEVGMNIKYIGRYTKRPVISETRLITCTDRWVIFKFKDYAQGGKTSIKKMGVFTFITYLTSHIQEKNFRVVRGYGLFSNRLKGTLLPKARILLKQASTSEMKPIKPWRERIAEYYGKDPFICETCGVEMILVQVCFEPPHTNLLSLLKLSKNDAIPQKQIRLFANSS